MKQKSTAYTGQTYSLRLNRCIINMVKSVSRLKFAIVWVALLNALLRYMIMRFRFPYKDRVIVVG